MPTIRKIAPAVVTLVAAVAFAASPAGAEEMKHDMGMMSMSAESPSKAGYLAAMDKMHADMMAVKYTGDADADFVRGMIPHHQAAIDMAKVLIDHGSDPELRKLAEAIITAQEKEIEEMEGWLAAHPGK